jgi:hypothetical protein
MRRSRLRGNHHICTVAGGAQRNGETDAAAAAGDEQRLAGEAGSPRRPEFRPLRQKLYRSATPYMRGGPCSR